MHIHVNALQFLINLAETIIALFLMRAVSYTFPDSTIGKALAVL